MIKKLFPSFVVLCFLFVAKPAFATTCISSVHYEDALIVARVEKIIHACKSRTPNNNQKYISNSLYLENLQNVIGKAPKNLIVEMEGSGVYSIELCTIESEKEITNTSDFTKGQLYLLSVYENHTLGGYTTGGCNSVMKQLHSENDPLIWQTKFKIISDNILLSGFTFTFWLSEKMKLNQYLSLGILLLYYAIPTIFLISAVVFVLKRIMKRTKNNYRNS